MRTTAELDPRLEPHRKELTAYCYRMLGSGFEAEDAVQETLVRAWKRFDTFDGSRAKLRTWLYAIATNVCLDMLRSPQRRARPMDFGSPAAPGDPLGPGLAETAWIQPIPDDRVVPGDGDPAEVIAIRDSVRLAFVAALQHLPPKQRAVLILRDVLAWSAKETATLVGSSVASVNSALQRARATVESLRRDPMDAYQPLDGDQQDLLRRYVKAFEAYDIDDLTALLHEDATNSMPPLQWWIRGRDHIRAVMTAVAADSPCKDSRLLPTAANGQPAFGQYWPDGQGGHRAFALVILTVSGGTITETTTYLDPDRLFPLFGLPATL